MKAITVQQYSGSRALAEVPDPHVNEGQVLIDVAAAGVNPVDEMIAAGAMRDAIPATFPLILGVDFAGTVDSVGDAVTRFQAGQPVFGQLMVPPLGSAGTYAERIAVTQDAPIALIPAGLDPVDAAALPTAGVTALQIIESLGSLTDKTVLLVGAAGGVGSYATQLAINAGAQVIAVVGPQAAKRMRTYGVAETIDYTAGRVAAAVAAHRVDGLDILIDVASDAEGFASLAALVRPGGTALTTKGVADVPALGSRDVTGVNFVSNVTADHLGRLAGAVVNGTVSVPPITRIKLDEVPALGDIAANGKTVIVF